LDDVFERTSDDRHNDLKMILLERLLKLQEKYEDDIDAMKLLELIADDLEIR
jgi:hypothetical protein